MKRPASAAERVCIALDFSDAEQVFAAARRFAPKVGWLKIGLEAFVGEGPPLVRSVAELGPRVFLDLKLHDIPATVEAAVAAAARSGASLVDVHASGGRAMLQSAALAARRGGIDLVAVTLLTSLDAAALADLPIAGHPEGIARRLARLAQECGCDGVVCAASDLPAIRSTCAPELFTVVPGIRLPETGRADQRRVASPRAAIDAGADLLVVGRTVTGAADPDGALARVLAEIESASPP